MNVLGEALNSMMEKFADELSKRRNADKWGRIGATIPVAAAALGHALAGGRNLTLRSVGKTGADAALGYGLGRAAHRVLRGPVKESSVGQNLAHAAEIGGLGILAKPSYDRLKKVHSPETSEHEKRDAKYELAGLGLLAVPSAVHLGQSAYQKLKALKPR